MRPLGSRAGWNCLQLLAFLGLANSVPLLVVASAAGDDPPAHHARTATQPAPVKPAFLCLQKRLAR